MKKYFKIVVLMITCSILLCSCNIGKENENYDEKFEVEISRLDKELTNIVYLLTNNESQQNKVEVQETEGESTKSSGSEGNNGSSSESGNSGEGNNSDSSGGNSDNNSENGKKSEKGSSNEKENTITSMSIQKNDSDNLDGDNWNTIKNDLKTMYMSWISLQSDLKSSGKYSENIGKNIENSFDSMMLLMDQKDDKQMVKEIINIYSNILRITDNLNYAENKKSILLVKQRAYEAYYNVLSDDYDEAKKNLQSASNNIKYFDNSNTRIEVIFSNTIDGLNLKDKKVFSLKFSRLLDELNYLS